MLELPLLIWSMLFPKLHPAPDWMICHDQQPLVRLSHIGRHESYSHYVVGFVGIGVDEWESAYKRDPRDVPWEFVSSIDGHRVPYSTFDIGWSAERKEMWLKWGGCFSRVPDDWWTRLKACFGIPPEVVPQARAPITWQRIKERKIMRKLASEDVHDLADALSDVGYHASGSQLNWANEILILHALHRDRMVRRIAINGLGELARVRGFADHGRVQRVLSISKVDECKWVREAAETAGEEIRRFANG